MKDLLTRTLCNPAQVTGYSDIEWDLVVRQARRANLLARLCWLLQENALLEQIPARPRNHLRSAYITAEKLRRDVCREIRQIRQALSKRDIPIVLLKGAAYTAANIPAACGRAYSDIDFMVPKSIINKVEHALLLAGWVTTHMDKYDQMYYRKWMHELPPLKHIRRGSFLDVHHNILPDTARIHPDAVKLLAEIIPVEGHDNLYTLAPVDMVLHSATHLFHDGELEHGLRDLVDMDALLRYFGKDEQFWQQLALRAKELELTRPLYYALRYTQRYLQTPIPAETIRHSTTGKPNPLLSPIMDALFVRGLAPDHASCSDWFSGTARWLLYVRSHYLRMPLHLLIPHLVRKAIRARIDSK